MRKGTKSLILVSVLMLYGCAGAGQLMNQAEQQQLQSLHLFAADGSARFSLYVACTSDSVNCVNVGNAFTNWASDHGVTAIIVDPDDPAFTDTSSSSVAGVGLPLRVAIDYRPTIVPGHSATSYQHASESFAPKIEYSAVISVFEAATGKLLMRSPVHAQQSADHGKTANPYVRSDVRNLLDSLGAAAKGS